MNSGSVLSFHVSRLIFLLVYEEAHNYVPQSEGAKYGSVKKAIERIAKEGRKYGISMMIVSQRPSEIFETVFSQCNNFVAMRLTNPSDQHYVKRLLPDDLAAVTDALPSRAAGSHRYVDDIEAKPDSNDIKFLREWRRDWLPVVCATDTRLCCPLGAAADLGARGSMRPATP